MGRLYFLVGIARAGKSTIADRFVNFEVDIVKRVLWERPSVPIARPRVVIAGDNIRQALHGSMWNGNAEGFVQSTKYCAIKALLLRGFDVLHDGTNTSKRSLRDLFSIDNEADYYVLDTDIKTCEERARKTNQEYLYPVINRQYKNLAELTGQPVPEREMIIRAIEKLRYE